MYYIHISTRYGHAFVISEHKIVALTVISINFDLVKTLMFILIMFDLTKDGVIFKQPLVNFIS